MRKTHKKILGFAGLGLVAAVTTVAAVLPSPAALATNTQTDTLQIRVIPAESDIQVTPADGGEIHVPNYEFDVAYSGIGDIKAVLVNKDADGNIIFGPTELWHIDADMDPGSKHFTLNLNEYGGYGDFTITVTGIGSGGVPVEKTTVVKYTKEGGKEIDGGEIEADPETGEADVDIDIPKEEVTSIILNVYNTAGSLVMGPIDIFEPGSAVDVDFSGLTDGEYDGEIISRNSDRNVIGTKYLKIVIDKDATSEDVYVEVKSHTTTIKKASIKIKNASGTIITQKDFDDPVAGTNMTIELDGSVVAGNDYTITTEYYDENGNLVDTVTEPLVKVGAGGHGEIIVEEEIDTVKTIVGNIYNENGKLVRIAKADRETGIVYVYDPDGNLIETVPGGFVNGRFNISFTGLPYGDYKVKVSFLNQYDKPVGDTYVYTVHWYGTVPVPDTGGFFQGLNISREDYLITGLVVFMIISVVAFGVVARNRRNKVGRKNRK